MIISTGTPEKVGSMVKTLMRDSKSPDKEMRVAWAYILREATQEEYLAERQGRVVHHANPHFYEIVLTSAGKP
jgi:hypothetical protein